MTASIIGIAAWSLTHSSLYGFHIASLNGVQDAVICPIIAGSRSVGLLDVRTKWGLRECLDVPDAQFGFAVTIFTLGGLVGSLSANAASRRYGRAGTLRFAQAGFSIGSAAVGVANGIWLMAIGRILIGLSAGLVMVAVPPYLAFLSTKYKTVLGTLHQISIGVGMIIAQSLSLVLSRPMLWRIEMAIGTAIGMVLLVTGLMIGEPEEQREEDEEETPLLRDQSTKEAMGTREVFTSDVRYGTYVVMVAQCAQQICGISPVMYFSSRILKSTFGSNSKLVALAMMAIGIPVNFLPGLLKVQSKHLLILSLVGTALFSSLLGIGLNTHNQSLSGISIIMFVVSFSVGLAPVAWVVLSEVVPPEARTAVGSVAVGLNWLTNWTAVSWVCLGASVTLLVVLPMTVIGSVFLPLQDALGQEGNVFFVFASLSALACVAMVVAFRLYERHLASA